MELKWKLIISPCKYYNENFILDISYTSARYIHYIHFRVSKFLVNA